MRQTTKLLKVSLRSCLFVVNVFPRNLKAQELTTNNTNVVFLQSSLNPRGFSSIIARTSPADHHDRQYQGP
ncbi:MAG TPA: hypothetical protein DC054_18895 [Blastocatellia bacterium]|nr:hypothetical protein [Blastocatellia bacterium]